MDYLAWFDEIPENELALTAGGKGASLCRLTRGKLPVPEGFIVGAGMFDFFLRSSGLRDKVLGKIDETDIDNYSDLMAKSQEIREMITSEPMPDEMSVLIGKYYLMLGGGACSGGGGGSGPGEGADHPVAVRSSGTAEDLDDASFAGQMETFLYVRGVSDVVRYVRECWASLYTDRAIFYRRANSFSENDISIAVVVQHMVAADKAGVMFTVNPITKDRDICMIEGSWGLGEAVVSGVVTPDNYSVDKKGKLIDAYISEKEIMIVRKTEGSGVEEQEVPEDKREAQVLGENELKQLAALAVELENYFGAPQDVEWAIENGKLYLLQSRPITTL